MIFRPDIKPPMWGPPDAVAYAVRTNAERMGIGPDSFAGLWPMWECGGKIAYDVINANHGTMVNMDNPWTTAGIDFSGDSDDAISVPHSINFVFSTNATFFAKLRLRTFAADIGEGILSQYSLGTTVTPTIQLYSFQGKYVFRVRSDNGQLRTLSSQTAPYEAFVFGVKDGNSVRLYLNGSLEGSGSATFNTITNTNGIQIGRYWTTPSMDGVIDFCGTIHQALTVSQIETFAATPYSLLIPVSRPVYFDLGAGGSTLYSAIFDSLCRSSLLASRLADSRADAGLVATVTHDTAASVAEDRTSVHDSRLSAASLETLPIDTAAAVSTEALATMDSRAVVSSETSRGVDSRAEVSVLDSRSHDARAVVSALTARLTDTAVAVTELVNEIRWFDTRVDVADLASRLVDTSAAASREEARQIDSAAKVAALESRLIDTHVAVAGLLDEIRHFDTRVAASALEVAEVDLRAAVSLAEARAVDALAAVAECVTALHDTRLGAAELEARVWDTLANTGEILQALGPIFAPGLHSITVQRAVLSVTPVRGLRRFDGQ